MDITRIEIHNIHGEITALAVDRRGVLLLIGDVAIINEAGRKLADALCAHSLTKELTSTLERQMVKTSKKR